MGGAPFTRRSVGTFSEGLCWGEEVCNSCSSRPPKGGAHSRGHRQGAEDLPPSPPAAQLAGIPPSFSGALEKTTITPTHIGRCLALGGNGERPNCKDNIFEFVERCVVKLTYFCPLEMTQKHEFHVAAGQLNQEREQTRKGISGSGGAGAQGREYPHSARAETDECQASRSSFFA